MEIRPGLERKAPLGRPPRPTKLTLRGCRGTIVYQKRSQGAKNLRTTQEGMEDSAFLGHFWRLGNGDQVVRRAAISGLLRSLKATDSNFDVERKDKNTNGRSDEAITVDDLREKVDGNSIMHVHNHCRKDKRESSWKKKDFQFKLPRAESLCDRQFLDALEYTTNRLVHGLSSNREAVRQGYAAALAAILIEFPKAIPLSSVRSLLFPK